MVFYMWLRDLVGMNWQDDCLSNPGTIRLFHTIRERNETSS